MFQKTVQLQIEMAGAILKVKDLQKSYDGKKAVDDISFQVKKGEIFGILGPNGAGKTTTLEMIETLREIDGESAETDGGRLILTEGKSLLNLGSQLGIMTIWLGIIYIIAFRVFRWE